MTMQLQSHTTNVPSKLCACGHAHRLSARKKTWSAHKFSLKNVLARISYMSF